MRWRKEISAGLADIAFERLLAAPVSGRSPKRLRREAWRVAEALGWMKTYDAEDVALARMSRCHAEASLDDRRAQLDGAAEDVT